MKDIKRIRPVSGYPELEGKLIKVLSEYPPDFDTADELIRLGADVNAEGKDPEYNVLSEIIESSSDNAFDLLKCSQSNECGKIACSNCEQGFAWKAAHFAIDRSTLSVINYMLGIGFDVNKKQGLYGAQCLLESAFVMNSRCLIDATRILFDAGADQNKGVDPGDKDSGTAWGHLGVEAGYQSTCWADHHLANIYEAAWQMYFNRDQCRPYDGIDTYEKAIGKVILGVLADKPDHGEVFYSQGGVRPQHGNCFNSNLYFVLNDGILITTEYGEFWTDQNAPYVETIDISKRFGRILGSIIEDITFDHRSIVKKDGRYGQPITNLIMSNGKTLRFSINFGEVEEDKRAAYYNILSR